MGMSLCLLFSAIWHFFSFLRADSHDAFPASSHLSPVNPVPSSLSGNMPRLSSHLRGSSTVDTDQDGLLSPRQQLAGLLVSRASFAQVRTLAARRAAAAAALKQVARSSTQGSGPPRGPGRAVAERKLREALEVKARSRHLLAQVQRSVTLDRFEENPKDPSCPEIKSSWSVCTDECGQGTKYMLHIGSQEGVCATNLVRMPCISLEGCRSSTAKMAVFMDHKPGNIPSAILRELAGKIPSEEKWQRDPSGEGFSFETAPSSLFSGDKILSEDACGPATDAIFWATGKREGNTLRIQSGIRLEEKTLSCSKESTGASVSRTAVGVRKHDGAGVSLTRESKLRSTSPLSKEKPDSDTPSSAPHSPTNHLPHGKLRRTSSVAPVASLHSPSPSSDIGKSPTPTHRPTTAKQPAGPNLETETSEQKQENRPSGILREAPTSKHDPNTPSDSQTSSPPASTNSDLRAAAEERLEARKKQLVTNRGPGFARIIDSMKLESVAPESTNPACPRVTSTWSDCSASCSTGERYRLSVHPVGKNSCGGTLQQLPCIQVSDCTDLMKKWKLLHARTPEDMPQSVLADLAGKIPLEDKWQQVGTNDAPLMAFTTEWSKRYFDNKELSEAACGLGTKSRFVYTQEPSASGFLVVTRFEHQPATRMCERKSNQEQPELTRLQKPAEIPADKVAPTPPKPIALPPDKLKIFEAFKQQLRSGKDAVPEKALEQLKPVRFETNRKNPKCPEIDSTISDCQAECSLGASYSFSVRQNGGDCEVKAEKQKCIGLSECKNLSQKWKMLRQQPPASMPASHVEDLARLLPNSIPMRAHPQRPGNLCAVFNTQLSGRYALDGSPLSTDCGEGYRRYAAGGFLSDGKCFFSFGLVEESSICAVNDDEFDDGMLRKHNEIRGKYGVPLLKFDPRLKKFAEYWADRLNEEHECELYHSTPSIHRALVEGFENVGENLAVQCVGGNLRWQKVVQDWFSEILCYRYGKVGNACTADKLPKCDNKFHDEGVMVGHMTQMMADLSTHVGCAYRICQSSCRTASSPTRKFLIVCNYGPAGNIVGTHPFSKTVAEKLQRQLPGAALLPEAEEDDASQKKCQERHRQFKRQKPKEKL